MIDFDKQTITLGGDEAAIVKWVVMFQTPKGLLDDAQQAIKCCHDRDLDPIDVVAPVAVAVDSLGRYEIAGG